MAGRIEIENDVARWLITVKTTASAWIVVISRNSSPPQRSASSTGTGTQRQELLSKGREAAYGLIGQFGIGLLSAFVVADRVMVRRKLGQLETLLWKDSGHADCQLDGRGPSHERDRGDRDGLSRRLQLLPRPR